MVEVVVAVVIEVRVEVGVLEVWWRCGGGGVLLMVVIY